MRYPGNAKECIYCGEMTDDQAERLRTTVAQIEKRNRSLGLVILYMFVIASLIFLGVFLR
jgi:hypothetical protein